MCFSFSVQWLHSAALTAQTVERCSLLKPFRTIVLLSSEPHESMWSHRTRNSPSVAIALCCVVCDYCNFWAEMYSSVCSSTPPAHVERHRLALDVSIYCMLSWHFKLRFSWLKILLSIVQHLILAIFVVYGEWVAHYIDC